MDVKCTHAKLLIINHNSFIKNKTDKFCCTQKGEKNWKLRRAIYATLYATVTGHREGGTSSRRLVLFAQRAHKYPPARWMLISNKQMENRQTSKLGSPRLRLPASAREEHPGSCLISSVTHFHPSPLQSLLLFRNAAFLVLKCQQECRAKVKSNAISVHRAWD